METAGRLLVAAGVASTALSFFNYELQLLFWITEWGDTVAWAIRFALVVGGMLLVTAAQRRDRAATIASTAQPSPISER